MLAKTGIPSKEQVASRFPDVLHLVKPKAIIECYEDIPCNPCETSCPFGAITIGPDINQQPKLIVDKCTGCSICVTSCPGLAIVVAQSDGTIGRLKLPYEFLPRPVKGETWHAINRSGEIIGDCQIESVLLGRKQDRTTLVGIVFDASLLYDVVTIRRKP
jgi:Fe-S-cluster-containing hydrogenase component 2